MQKDGYSEEAIGKSKEKLEEVIANIEWHLDNLPFGNFARSSKFSSHAMENTLSNTAKATAEAVTEATKKAANEAEEHSKKVAEDAPTEKAMAQAREKHCPSLECKAVDYQNKAPAQAFAAGQSHQNGASL